LTLFRQAAAFLLILGIGSGPSGAVGEPFLDERQPAYTRPETAGRIWGHLQVFQKIGPRPAGSQAALGAGEYFAGQLKALGYEVQKQEFKDLEDAPGANWIADHGVSSGSFLMIAAHLDTVPKSPGINDDATGIAALIELAREVREQKMRQPVRFVAFGAEEHLPGYGRNYGAAQYLESLSKEERARIDGVIYLDKIGRGDRLLIKRAFNRDPSLARRLQPVAYKMLGQPSEVKRVWKLTIISPFAQYLIRVASVEWSTAPDTHQPSDVIDKIQVQRILQTIGFILNFLAAQ
jgi:hypothetical protein